MSDSLRPHGLWPTRLLRPWNFPGKSTGVPLPSPGQMTDVEQMVPFPAGMCHPGCLYLLCGFIPHSQNHQHIFSCIDSTALVVGHDDGRHHLGSTFFKELFCRRGTQRWASRVALVVRSPPASAGRLKRRGFNPRVRKIPWRRAQQPTPVFLPGESHGQRSWYSP